MEESPARDALETPDVPLIVQGNQGLAFNDLLPAAGAIYQLKR